MIYLDHAATTAVHPQALKEMLPYFAGQYWNPSGNYQGGTENKKKLEQVRKDIADSLNAHPEEIFFTSGGTESDNWALTGLAEKSGGKGGHLITTQIEHHAILHTCQYLQDRGFEVTYLPINEMGVVEPEAVRRAIRPDTIGISVMYANNEIGTLQPVAEIGRIASRHQIPFHTDAVQGYAHLPIDVQKEHITLLSASAHKFGGPKGTGFLYIRQGLELPSFLHGGGQERGRRAGTENVPGIIGMGAAARICTGRQEENWHRIRRMRDYLLARILSGISGVRLNGSVGRRLPGNLNLCFEGVEAQSLIVMMEMKGIYIAGGSACTASEHGPSHVLTALGLSETEARSSVRLTLGEENTIEEMEEVYQQLAETVDELRELKEAGGNREEITL